MTVRKAQELIQTSNSDRLDLIRIGIRNRIRVFIDREISDKLSESINTAVRAGSSDEEIMTHIKKILRKLRKSNP